jgi:hypothetical protein
LNVVLVLDVIAVPFGTYALLLRRPFVGGKSRVSLARMMGENVILQVILFSS